MDYYYRRSMGNGTVTSKFRISSTSDEKPRLAASKVAPVENGATHHPSNCVRCYKLKKKCSRTYPKCLYCTKAGSECEYIDRKVKKPCVEKAAVPKSVSIASLVHSEETEQPFENIELPPTEQSASKSAIAKKFNNRAISRQPSAGPPNLSDEFLVVKPIEDESLPSAFVRAYFASYSWRYPVVDQRAFNQSFEAISFNTETLVPLDVYLVMAVGCIVFDCNHGTSHYNTIFSDKMIESIVDIITYDPETDTQSSTLLVLLCIYAVNASNRDLAWSILGFLNRSIIYKTDFLGTSTGFSKNVFWAVHNLDRELSLMLNKPSQFVPVSIIRQSTDFSDIESDENLATLMTKAVELHKLQDRVLSLKLGLQANDKDALRQLSSDLESWRVSVSSVVHSEYADSPLLTRVIGVVHLDYYYLLIEIDQLSSTESFQFTLQFLSNSFSLLLNESSSNKDVSGISLYSFFWFSKFFKVIDYNLNSLLKTLHNKEVPRSDVSLRLSDFNGNLQLIVNLLKYLLNSSQSPAQYKPRMTSWVQRLTLLNIKLMGSDILSASEEQYNDLLAKVDSILSE
ncbi:uncharacterized protein CXQ87_001967 [Candidozyma duobushaemuli]|uniref:Zn(2)-C6 fungal-type domain-containing protein n=2 Tax=Candidozyma TaxID=3303203 RepID=A0ABX8I624_9ASCO|nr:uncharacterized protein CXQ87_001967 [[Candida] duobushaemulonis]PVH13849.1 hypothetical protein CXQ87_001967 [[Candida] duobushaemulonis]QWU87924.1 hypothetical protein CA3LBN_002189 [[Candida] haemuloni]